tara:strand:- start:517 stop:1332 length:816 start_codon:yes stop_codon:yes gene_type:complete
MEKNIRIIKISSDNSNKNNKRLYKKPYNKNNNPSQDYLKTLPISKKNELYTDILSSSKKVMDIIKKTKRNRNMYNNEKNLKPKSVSFNVNDEPKAEAKAEAKAGAKAEAKAGAEAKAEAEAKAGPQEFVPKKTKRNLDKYFKYSKPKVLEKKTIKKKPIGTTRNNSNNSKKLCIQSKSSDVLKFFNKKNSTKIKIFTKKEIKRFIHVMMNYSLYENYKFIHKYIKKLNKYQTNQILFALRLISKKSKAPVKLLKNILYGYFCSNNLIIVKQ